MSLINDALKKARQAQAKSPPRESAPQLKSPATDHPARSGPMLVLPAIIVAVGLIGAALVWAAIATSNKESKSGLVETPRPVVSPEPEPAASAPSNPEPQTRAALSPPPPPATKPPESDLPVVVVEPTATVPAAKSTPPKLDGIFFHPSKPTAVVNNKLVSPGSRVGDLTVLAITQNTVTLTGGGQTNVLSLSE